MVYNMQKTGYTYIITNKNNTVLYVGVTADIVKRIWEHKNKLYEGFSKKYNLDKLVYYEILDSMDLAIQREKYLKGKMRAFKKMLIDNFNPSWTDLYESILPK